MIPPGKTVFDLGLEDYTTSARIHSVRLEGDNIETVIMNTPLFDNYSSQTYYKHEWQIRNAHKVNQLNN